MFNVDFLSFNFKKLRNPAVLTEHTLALSSKQICVLKYLRCALVFINYKLA